MRLLKALDHSHLLGLAYNHAWDPGIPNWYVQSWPLSHFLLLLDTNLLPPAGFIHYSQLPSKLWPPLHDQGFCKATSCVTLRFGGWAATEVTQISLLGSMRLICKVNHHPILWLCQNLPKCAKYLRPVNFNNHTLAVHGHMRIHSKIIPIDTGFSWVPPINFSSRNLPETIPQIVCPSSGVMHHHHNAIPVYRNRRTFSSVIFNCRDELQIATRVGRTHRHFKGIKAGVCERRVY